MSTPQLKFENSPTESLADSFVSTPGAMYPLFESIDPVEVMTPESYDGDSVFGDMSRVGSVAGTPAPEKKTVKKRKSWGQQLPEPKTNLPPRKRAKTEDEKEQRRVERVLRNRRAAQSSRERKRQEVDALEQQKLQVERRNADLEAQLVEMHARCAMLQQELERAAGGKMTVFSGSPQPSPAHTDSFRQTDTPVTFSHELFTSKPDRAVSSLSDNTSPRTVNPATLSPEIRAVAESSNAASSDMTQHPAAMLCDLPCQSEASRPWMGSAPAATSISPAQALRMLMHFSVAACWALLGPLSQITSSLKTGSPLPATPSILTTIIWLSTTPATLTLTSTTSSTTSTSGPKASLRIRLLKRLLACSPHLARPLRDATMSAMRLRSKQQEGRDCLFAGESARDGDLKFETLMTMLWAIRLFEKQELHSPTGDAPEVNWPCLVSATCPDQEETGLAQESASCGSDMYRYEGMESQKSLEDWSTAFKH